jgi:hypothetical protein
MENINALKAFATLNGLDVIEVEPSEENEDRGYTAAVSQCSYGIVEFSIITDDGLLLIHNDEEGFIEIDALTLSTSLIPS